MDTAAPWRITLLGSLRVAHEADIVTRFRSQKVGDLLAYLALFPRRSHTREELADLSGPMPTWRRAGQICAVPWCRFVGNWSRWVSRRDRFS